MKEFDHDKLCEVSSTSFWGAAISFLLTHNKRYTTVFSDETAIISAIKCASKAYLVDLLEEE